jgi:thiol-disulfide isomerase/thioredoxin
MLLDGDMTARARVRAPELIGKGGWLNTGDNHPTLADLRGSIVILDFWTFCCVNCLHVLDELRELEERHRDTVVIVGVHSPKFVHEAEHQAVVDAVERYEVHHPVLDDPDLATWRQYAVRAWPTLVVIDPEGYVVAQHAGEGHAHALETLVTALEAEHAAKGTLRRGDGPYVPPEPVATDLRFPGKALALPGSGHYLVSDSTRHALVELAADGESVVRRIGTGERGLVDGDAATARFSEPQGLALLPDGSVIVADTVNHVLRRLDVESGRVTTVAGTGSQWWQGSPSSGPAREVELSSPWDVAWFEDRVWIAMAGVHQLWTYDPATERVEAAAGTTNEGLVDGHASDAWFAQPSGLAAAGNGLGRLWVADSENSALRWVERSEGDGYVVRTAVGTGLFDFGHRDGPAGQALLQHPLGVTVLPDEVRVAAVAHRTRRAATDMAPGPVRLDVVFSAPEGQKLDERYGPSTRLLVSATPPELLAEGAGKGTDLGRDLVLDPAVGEGVLHVSAMAASCDDPAGSQSAAEYPACHVHQQDWGVPVRLRADGGSRLALVLAGLDETGMDEGSQPA